MGRFSNLELDDGQPRDDRGEGQRASAPRPDQLPAINARDEDAYDAHGLIRIGWRAHFDAQHEEALRRFGQALQEDSRVHEGWVGQIDSLTALGQIREAEIWATRALDQFPDDATILSLRAVLLARQGMAKRAVGTSDYAMAQGESLRAWICRGEVLLALDSPNANVVLDKALTQIEPHDWMNLTRIAQAFARHRRHAKAIPAFQQALAVEPGHARLWCQLAESQVACGFTQEAIASGKHALEIEPDSRATQDLVRRLTKTNPLASLWRKLKRRK